MLLMDGIKYEVWTPPSEDEFERVVKEHATDIFGEESIYLDIKQKLKSKSGIGSIPDGYVIAFQPSPHWQIVEVELSSHPVFEHIVPQMNRFTIGIKNPLSQKEIVGALFEEIGKDSVIKEKIVSKSGSAEIYKFLSDLVSRLPKLAILIDTETEELTEAVEVLKLETEVIEFRTFVKEGIGISEHAHLFEPLGPEPPLDPRMQFLKELRKRFADRRLGARVSKVSSRGYCYIPIVEHSDIHTEWLFWGKEGLGVELHLERASHEENLRLLRKMEANRDELEENIGEPLSFQFSWHRRRARVYALKELIELTEELKEWAVETMVKFYDAFKPLLDKIDTKSQQ